ncbi:MAG: AAA family ATPase [Thermodesulfobacteriota bacterium]
MRIKSLHITGFKSLRDVTWEPGALNVVIGPNGSGKSNLLTALELLSASAQGKLGKFVQRLGGMGSVVWDRGKDDVTFEVLSGPFRKTKKNDDIRYFFSLSQLGHAYSYDVSGETLHFLYPHDSNKKYAPDINQIDSIEGFHRRAADETRLSTVPEIPPVSRSTTGMKAMLANYCVYSGIDARRGADVRIPPVSRYELRVDADGSNFINVLHTHYSKDRHFQDDIDTAMRAAFGPDYGRLEFPPAADQRIQLVIFFKHLMNPVSLGDISDGTLRFLFLMTVLAAQDLSPTPLIAIDEPETGLHPSMFPIIAEYAAQTAKKTQVVFTTHSPQFLDACEPFSPTVTVAGWEQGETTLKNLDGDLLTKWLADYTLGHMFESGDLEALA